MAFQATVKLRAYQNHHASSCYCVNETRMNEAVNKNRENVCHWSCQVSNQLSKPLFKWQVSKPLLKLSSKQGNNQY